jgi:hypothetical protein
MTAGLETPQDTRGYKNPVGNLVQKVLVARQLAEDERNYAEKKALEQGVTLEELGIQKGHFFKKALKYEFGGEKIGEKISKLKGGIKNLKLANRIKNNPKAIGALLKRKFINVEVKSKKAKNFRKLFDYTDGNPSVKAVDKKIPGTAKKIQKATTRRTSRISREEILSTFNILIDSLNKTAEKLGQNSEQVSSGIMRASVAQADIAEQLKVRNNTIEDKLDALINAINNQTQFQKQTIDTSEDYQQKQKLAQQRDVAASEIPDNLSTKINESNTLETITPTTSITNIQNIGVGSAREAEMKQMEAYGYPQAERGGIISGPDTGYLAKLHGDEMVVPLRNRYTEGKPSAVDGITRPKPYERGTGYSSVGGRMGFGITNMMGIAGGGTSSSSRIAQPLVDAMSLPMMATGGTILATTTQMMKSMGGAGENISPEIEKITRPIADSFGLPASLTHKAKSGLPKSKEREENSYGKKDIIARLTEGFSKLLESFGKKVDEIPTNPTPPPGGNPDLSPVSLQGMSHQDTMLLGKMLNAEAGTSQEGTAHVLNSILNRQREIKQGLVTPEAWGITGKKASEVTISDILMAPGQYSQSIPKLPGITEQQALTSLNAAIKGGGLDPAKIKQNAIASGKSEAEANALALSETYYNPTIATSTPFRDHISGAPLPTATTGNKHTFMQRVMPIGTQVGSLSPVKQTPSTPVAPVDLGQQLTSYDSVISPNVKKYFNVPGYGKVQAYKTTTGFDFYNSNNQKIDMKSNTAQAPKILQAFEQYMQTESISKPDNKVSFTPRNSSGTSSNDIATADSISGVSNIVALTLPSNQQTKTSSSALPATDNTGRGLNPLSNSGHYSEFINA